MIRIHNPPPRPVPFYTIPLGHHPPKTDRGGSLFGGSISKPRNLVDLGAGKVTITKFMMGEKENAKRRRGGVGMAKDTPFLSRKRKQNGLADMHSQHTCDAIVDRHKHIDKVKPLSLKQLERNGTRWTFVSLLASALLTAIIITLLMARCSAGLSTDRLDSLHLSPTGTKPDHRAGCLSLLVSSAL